MVDVFGEKKPKIFSTVDMFSGYHQVPMAPESRKYTAFSTPDGGHFEFYRLSFGLTNAPAHFMHAMTSLLRNMMNKFTLCYLDDLIVFFNQLAIASSGTTPGD